MLQPRQEGIQIEQPTLIFFSNQNSWSSINTTIWIVSPFLQLFLVFFFTFSNFLVFLMIGWQQHWIFNVWHSKQNHSITLLDLISSVPVSGCKLSISCKSTATLCPAAMFSFFYMAASFALLANFIYFTFFSSILWIHWRLKAQQWLIGEHPLKHFIW